MSEALATTGDRLRRLRLSAGLTQARLCDEAGVSQSLLSSIENGSRRFNEDTLGRVARALGVRPSALIDPDDPITDAWQQGFEAGCKSVRLRVEAALNPKEAQDAE